MSMQTRPCPEVLVAVACVVVEASWAGKLAARATVRLIDAGPAGIGRGRASKVKLPAPSGKVHFFAGPSGPEQLASGIQPALTVAAKFPPLTVTELTPLPVIVVEAPKGMLDGTTLLIFAAPPQSFHVKAKFVNGASAPLAATN